MTDSGGKKREPPLRLGMDFSEALERFIATDPREMPNKAAKVVGEGLSPPATEPAQAERGQPRKWARTNSSRPNRKRQ